MPKVAAAPVLPVNDEMLQGLWSTDPGRDEESGVTASAETSGLESLWMGRVASETGQYAGTGVDLESLWMNELSTESGTTAASASNEISFDDDGIDTELAQYRGGPRGGSSPRTRVDRAPAWQPRTYPVMQEARAVTVRSDRTASIREIRQRAIELVPPPPPAPAPRRSAEARAIEYASRTTVYQRLMSDDD